MNNAITWFEIPSTDFERAIHFYEQAFGVTLQRDSYAADGQMAIFPHGEQEGVGGAVVHMPMLKPGADGAAIYLNAGADLSVPLGRVAALGGKVLVPKTLITPEIGYFAVVLDCEGNRVGLHSPC